MPDDTPTEEEAQAFGLTVEEASAPPVEIWPDNVQSLEIFDLMTTQWHVGVAGATGLDYGALRAVLQFRGLPRKHWATVFDDLRVMERAALDYFIRLRDQKQP